MMKENISIIIPCYNTGKYIEKCLNSLIEQVKQFDYEIILIDDCSKDDTAEVIENYISSHDYNIIFLKNKENIGAGASRNKAVQIARYDYVSFIDSDDYISEDFYKNMLEALQENNADLVTCDIVVVDSDTDEQTLCEAYNGAPGKYSLLSTGLAASPCNKIFKKEYLIRYPFAEGIMNEDVASVLSIVANCEKVAYAEKADYYYVQRSGSVQNSSLSYKRLDIVKAVDIFSERIKDNPDYEKFLNVVVFNQIICFFLFVPMKYRGIIRRALFLKEFRKVTKKYDFNNNEHYRALVEDGGRKKKLFFDLYTGFFKNGLYLCSSIMASLAGLYERLRIRKKVIKKEIEIKDVITAAENNSKINSSVSVSAAIPNYNYADYLYQRIYSILNQDYRISELIILDDCSKDNSRDIIDDLIPRIEKFVNIKKIYNTENSGSPFKQWQKAFENASSEYLWIAEADDFCNKKMLSSIMRVIEKDKEISIAYCDTAFINNSGNITVKTIKPSIDIMNTGHWDKSYVIDGVEEIKNYAFLNCTIANVSSVVFKRRDYSNEFAKAGQYHQVGDYHFYLSVMQKGKVAFVNKPLNYYRVHGTNVTSTTKKILHFEELKKVHNELNEVFPFTDEQKKQLNERYDFLRRIWKLDI